MSQNGERNEGMTEGISEEGSSRRKFFRNLALIGVGSVLFSGRSASAKSVSAKKEKPRIIDWEHYAPPPEGVVLERFVKPNNKKTILYLPNEHPVTSSPINEDDKDDFRTIRVQRQLYFIVADLVERGLKIALVRENRLEDKTPQQLREEIDNIGKPHFVFERVLNQWEIGLYQLIAAFRENPRVPRKKLTNVLIKEWRIDANAALIATFPEEIVPIGCMSHEDMARDERLSAMIRDWNEKIFTLQCPNAPLALSEAAMKFIQGNKAKEVVDCYCGVKQQGTRLKEVFANERQVIAAKKEIKRALEYKGAEECTAVISGVTHLHEALRALRARQDVNYLVVAPKAIETEARLNLVEPINTSLRFPDSEDGTCAQWETARKK